MGTFVPEGEERDLPMTLVDNFAELLAAAGDDPTEEAL